MKESTGYHKTRSQMEEEKSKTISKEQIRERNKSIRHQSTSTNHIRKIQSSLQKQRGLQKRASKQIERRAILLRCYLVLLEKKIKGGSDRRKQKMSEMRLKIIVKNFKHIIESLRDQENNKEKKRIHQWLIHYLKQQDPIEYLEEQQLKELCPQINILLNSLRKNNNQCSSVEEQTNWFVEFTKKYRLFNMKQINQINVLRHDLQQGCPVCNTLLSDGKCKKGYHLISFCQNCQWREHTCVKNNVESQNKQNYLSYFDIVTIGKTIKSFQLTRVEKTSEKNNIEKVVKEQNYEYTTKQKIIPGTPTKIVCNYPLLPKESVQQVYENRKEQKYLPLTIKQSSIANAGLGVFATRDIEEDLLICSYIGQIGVGNSTSILRKKRNKMQINDSIFTLGWLEQQIMIMTPNLYSNVGRFINYNEQHRCNLQASICLLEKQKQKYEIAVLLISRRLIKKGEELFYSYGDSYTSEDKSTQQSNRISSTSDNE